MGRDEDGGAEHAASDSREPPESLRAVKGHFALDYRIGVPGSGRSEFPRWAGTGARAEHAGERSALVGRETKSLRDCSKTCKFVINSSFGTR